MDTWTCTNVDASTTNCIATATSTQTVHLAESGDILFGIAFLGFFLAILFFGFLFDAFKLTK